MSSRIPKEIRQKIEDNKAYILNKVDKNKSNIEKLHNRVCTLEEKMDIHFEALMEDNRNNIDIILEGMDLMIDRKFDEKFAENFHKHFSREIKPITQLLMNYDNRIGKLESA